MGYTLADKIWRTIWCAPATAEPDLIYIDMHLLHEVNTPPRSPGCAPPAARSAAPT